MPPRVANEIRLVTPVNGAGPTTANDYDIGLPLCFEGGFYHRRILLPFLLWADGVVAAGDLPVNCKATIPLFGIEGLMFSFVVWLTAAATKKLVGTALKVGYARRLLAHLLLRHFAEPFSSASTFLNK